MRVSIPEFATKKDLFDYLKGNEKELISQKKSFHIKSEASSGGCESIHYSKLGEATKSEGFKALQDTELKTGEIRVKAFANTIGWCDSHMDVLIRDCALKTINDKGASNQILFYHLKNHEHSTEGIIGRDAKASLQDVSLSRFNIDSEIKTTQVIMGSSIVSKEYDKKAYLLYSDNQIKQHSIGMQYVKLYLCVDSEEAEDAVYKDNWEKYYNQVINKDKVDSAGFFWAVTEIRLLEFSAVLFGSNPITPTEGVSKTSNEPLKDTQGNQEEPPKSTPPNRERNLLYL